MRHRPAGLALALTFCAACAGQAPASAGGPPASRASAPPTAHGRPPPTPPATRPTPGWPASRRDDLVETIHGVPVADPYRWLEDAGRPEVQAWMQAQDAHARRTLAALPGRDTLAARLARIAYQEYRSPPSHEGGRWFLLWRGVHAEQASLVVREREDGPERVLLDPGAWSTDGSASLGAWTASPDGRLVAYQRRRDNADAAELRIVDVATGKDLPDVIAGGRHAYPSFTPDSRGFYYTWTPTDPAIPDETRPGELEIRFHTLGTDPATDTIVVPARHDPTVFPSVSLSRDGHWLMVSVGGWSKDELWVRDLRRRSTPPAAEAWSFEGAGFFRLGGGADARYQVDAWKDRLYVFTNEGAPRGRFFQVDPQRPAREAWKELVPESPTLAVESWALAGGRLLVIGIEDVQGVAEIRGLDGRRSRRVALPPDGSIMSIRARPDDDALFVQFSSLTIPRATFRASASKDELRVWHQEPLPFDATELTTETVRYRSRDGTEVPMRLFHRKDWRRGGGATPTLLYGYGGFGVAETPYFSAPWALWVAEHGGVVAMPALRGGGELGEAWHRAGMRGHKQNVFDDFIAAAEWLVAERITTPAHLAITGGSNGGLLVGAAMTQRPELFGAVVCAVPLLDMVRFHRFGSGSTWIDEYGSPDRAEDFRWLYAYSPYHHVKDGTAYPALLMLSADADDRVDPMHARKFVAAVQAATTAAVPVLLRIEAHAGHGGAALLRSAVDQGADVLAFLLATVG